MSVLTHTVQHTATAEQVKTAKWLAALLNELGVPTGEGPDDTDVVVNRLGYIGTVGYDNSKDAVLKANADLIAARGTAAGYAFRVVTWMVHGKECAYVTNRPAA
jgi:hypothetical protein